MQSIWKLPMNVCDCVKGIFAYTNALSFKIYKTKSFLIKDSLLFWFISISLRAAFPNSALFSIYDYFFSF